MFPEKQQNKTNGQLEGKLGNKKSLRVVCLAAMRVRRSRFVEGD